MQLRIMVCNVCRSEFSTDSGEIVGFDFKSNGIKDHWVMKRAVDCENHICKTCIDNAKALWSELAVQAPPQKQ